MTRRAGYYVNLAAFAVPAVGEWGNAGRNSITGPAQFSLNAGITRTFLLSNRWSMDWRIDATNILNRVTYSGLNTIVGSPQFGLPNRGEPDAKLLSSLRVRVLMSRAALLIAVLLVSVVSCSILSCGGTAIRLPRGDSPYRRDGYRHGQGGKRDRRTDRQGFRDYRGRRAAADRVRRIPAPSRICLRAHFANRSAPR